MNRERREEASGGQWVPGSGLALSECFALHATNVASFIGAIWATPKGSFIRGAPDVELYFGPGTGDFPTSIDWFFANDVHVANRSMQNTGMAADIFMMGKELGPDLALDLEP